MSNNQNNEEYNILLPQDQSDLEQYNARSYVNKGGGGSGGGGGGCLSKLFALGGIFILLAGGIGFVGAMFNGNDAPRSTPSLEQKKNEIDLR